MACHIVRKYSEKFVRHGNSYRHQLIVCYSNVIFVQHISHPHTYSPLRPACIMQAHTIFPLPFLSFTLYLSHYVISLPSLRLTLQTFCWTKLAHKAKSGLYIELILSLTSTHRLWARRGVSSHGRVINCFYCVDNGAIEWAKLLGHRSQGTMYSSPIVMLPYREPCKLHLDQHVFLYLTNNDYWLVQSSKLSNSQLLYYESHIVICLESTIIQANVLGFINN
jgi:hypothetical protein